MTCEIEIIADLFARYQRYLFWRDILRVSGTVFIILCLLSMAVHCYFEGKLLWTKVAAIFAYFLAAISFFCMAISIYQFRVVLRVDITRAIALYGLDAIDTADSHLGGIFSRLLRIVND